MTTIPISIEDYFRNEITADKEQAQIHHDEKLNKIEMERKDIEPKVTQPATNMDT